MKINASPLESSECEVRGAEVVEFSFGPSGLRIVVLVPSEDSDWCQEIVFPDPRGFRVLEEGDLSRYWESGEFTHRRHSVFEITAGGWMAQELRTDGMLTTTDAVGWYREWFVLSQDQCANVIAKDEPVIRRL